MPRRRTGKRDMLLPAVGWLFADLLLALAVLFMISTIPPKLTPNPKPTPIPKPTPKPIATIPANQRILDLKPFPITLTTDNPQALSNGDTDQMATIAQQIRQQMSSQQNRLAGLVIVYGQAQNDAQIPQALNIATTVYNVLTTLGGQKFIFCNAVNYKPLYNLGPGYDPGQIQIDVFMYRYAAVCQ